MSDDEIDPPLWVKRKYLRELVAVFEEFPVKHRWQILALCGRRLPFVAKIRLAFKLFAA